MGIPLLLIANKQDAPGSLTVEEIRENYEAWAQRKKESAARTGDREVPNEGRMASLDVMAVSALEGSV